MQFSKQYSMHFNNQPISVSAITTSMLAISVAHSVTYISLIIVLHTSTWQDSKTKLFCFYSIIAIEKCRNLRRPISS